MNVDESCLITTSTCDFHGILPTGKGEKAELAYWFIFDMMLAVSGLVRRVSRGGRRCHVEISHLILMSTNSTCCVLSSVRCQPTHREYCVPGRLCVCVCDNGLRRLCCTCTWNSCDSDNASV